MTLSQRLASLMAATLVVAIVFFPVAAEAAKIVS